MQWLRITTVATLTSLMSLGVLLSVLEAQESRQFTDLRGRAYSTEELANALFPPAAPAAPLMRGITPGVPPTPQPTTAAVALNVFFPFNSANILPRHYDDLNKLGHVLTSPQYARNALQIAGHTDSTGPETYNQALSGQRAASIKRYLVEKFAIDPNRLDVAGYGEEHPIAPNTTRQGRGKNRRVEVVNAGR